MEDEVWLKSKNSKHCPTCSNPFLWNSSNPNMSKTPISRAGSLEDIYRGEKKVRLKWEFICLLASLWQELPYLSAMCVCNNTSEGDVPWVWHIYYILWFVCKQGKAQTHSIRCRLGYLTVCDKTSQHHQHQRPYGLQLGVCLCVCVFFCVPLGVFTVNHQRGKKKFCGSPGRWYLLSHTTLMNYICHHTEAVAHPEPVEWHDW